VKALRRKLLRDLWARKGAFTALALIVTVGVGVHVSMASVFRDLDGARARYYRAQRLADFQVDLKRLPTAALARVSALPNVRLAQGRVSTSVLLDMPGRIEPISGTAISLPSPATPRLNDVVLVRGTHFSGRDDRETILNDAFAEANGLAPGDRIKVTLIDAQHELLVVGTAMSPEFVYMIPPEGGLAPDPERFGVFYCTESFLRRTCDQEGAVNQVLGLVHDDSPGALDVTLRQIEDLLDDYGVVSTTPARDQVSVRFLADELAGLEVSATVLPGLFLLVAAGVLNVLLSRMVAQQRGVVGTLRALGVSSGGVTRHFLASGLLVGAVGGLGGLALGAWLQQGMLGIYAEFYAIPGIRTHAYWDILGRGLGVSLACAMLGAASGARQAARLQPAEAMRPPPPERGGAILLERISFLWRRLSFRSRLVLRTVLRNPFRSALSAFAFCISTGLITMSLCNVEALDVLVRHEFERVSHQDMTVSLRNPAGADALGDLRQMGGLDVIEPQLAVGCELSSGNRRKRTGVTGLAPGHTLYTPLDERGEGVRIPARGLVLSRKLAEILGVGLGDTVRLRPLIGRRQEVTAPVVGLVDTFMGLGAYADLSYLARLLGEDDSPNLLLVTTTRTGDPGGQQAVTDEVLRGLKTRPVVVGVGQRTRALDQIEASFGEVMGTMIGAMVLFAGLIAFGSVLNATLVSLSERQREVGTLRVLGYTPTQVASIFAGESLLLGGAGIVAGLLLGVGLSYLLAQAYSTELYRFPVVIRASSLAQAAGLMSLFLIAAQLVVLYLIHRLDWLDALKVKE
jgi:putative ABC transport system permease protein